MGKHDLMGEERHPFEGVRTVGSGAANQFMLAVGKPDEFGLSELANQSRAAT